MVSFRRLVMASVLLVIVAGIAMAANTAPVVNCDTNAQQTTRFRQESKTELLPPLTFQCIIYNQLPNQGVPVQSGTIYDWEVFFPANPYVPLTSSPALIGDMTEPQLTGTASNAGATPIPLAVYQAPFPADPVTTAGMYNGNGSSGGSVIFAQVDMNPMGWKNTGTGPDVETVTLSITGLRASVLNIASNPPNYGGALVLTVWAKPSQTKNSANLTNPGNVFPPMPGSLVPQPTIQVPLGYAAPSLVVSVGPFPTPFDWRQCFSWSYNQGKNWAQFFYVDFTELYSYAFGPPVDGWETNKVPPNGPDATGDGGTRLFFQFSSGDNGWPSFVTVSVPQAVMVVEGQTTVVVEAVLVQGTDAKGNGGTRMAVPDFTSFQAINHHLYNTDPTKWYDSVDDWVPVTTMVVYEILPGALDAVTTTLEVPVMGMITGPIDTVYPPPDTKDSVTIQLAGYAPFDAPNVAIDIEKSPIPRYVTPTFTATPNLLAIDPCTTNLLFPYLVAGAGWDTGVAVANTGLDPFGKLVGYGSSAKFKPDVPGVSGDGNEQPGVCLMYFYGSFNSGTPLVPGPPNYVPPTPIVLSAHGFKQIQSNGSYAYTAGGGDQADLIQPGTTAEDMIWAVLALVYPSGDFAHGWNGYAIAQCDFLYAHGFAFGASKVGAGMGVPMSFSYLALVFDQRGIQHPSQIPEKMTF